MSDTPMLFSSNFVVALAREQRTPDVPGIHTRSRVVAGRRWALVDYAPGARREEWCQDGHVGVVLDGRIRFEFRDSEAHLTLEAGDGFSLETGQGHRGACTESEGVQLFLIDDPSA